jgi:hypothetical protein
MSSRKGIIGKEGVVACSFGHTTVQISGHARRTGRFRRGTGAALEARQGRHRRQAVQGKRHRPPSLVRVMAEPMQQTGCNLIPVVGL